MRAGAIASLRPHVNVPAQAKQAMLRVTPVTIASWALGGFYFSLMPALVRVATGVTLPVVGGLVVSALTLSGAISVLGLRTVPARRMLSGGTVVLAAGVAVTLAGVREQLVWLMLLGTVVSGIGFGAAFSGSMRTVLPLAKTDERAELLAAFYVEGYLSFSLPAVLTGLAVPMVGLTAAAYGYGAAVIVMALASMVAVTFRGSKAIGRNDSRAQKNAAGSQGRQLLELTQASRRFLHTSYCCLDHRHFYSPTRRSGLARRIPSGASSVARSIDASLSRTRRTTADDAPHGPMKSSCWFVSDD